MRHLRFIAIVASLLSSTGCSFLISRATQDFAEGISTAMTNANDPALVQSALPAYIILLEGRLAKEPENAELLTASAMLYLSYGSLFVTDPVRSARLADKYFFYAERAACLKDKFYCHLQTISYKDLTQYLNNTEKSGVPMLFLLSAAWGQWIQVHQSDWTAVAQLAQVKAIMQRVLVLDETYEYGAVHMYLGEMESLIPPAMGGKPEVAQAHFEKAIAISHGRNLSAKVEYAHRYARMMFDRELHDKLLKEVLSENPETKGLTLTNVIAQQQAKLLLESANDYF